MFKGIASWLLGDNSPPAQTPAVTLTATPWRKTRGWGNGLRCQLKDHIADLAPQTRDQLDVSYFNIVLTGPISAGKSSFINSVNSIYQERNSVCKADTGTAAESLTQAFRVYNINPHPEQPDSTPLPWRICDTMGLDPSLETDYDVMNILKAVDGHVPDGFRFPNCEILQDSTPQFVPTPELKDKAHCVAVVVDGSAFYPMKDSMKRKLRRLRRGLTTRDIRTYILITHIDEACEKVNEDVSKVYRSIAIRDIVSKVSKMLNGLPENQIFPIMNYKEQIELDDNMDILLLYALRQMLYSAQGHLENKM